MKLTLFSALTVLAAAAAVSASPRPTEAAAAGTAAPTSVDVESFLSQLSAEDKQRINTLLQQNPDTAAAVAQAQEVLPAQIGTRVGEVVVDQQQQQQKSQTTSSAIAVPTSNGASLASVRQASNVAAVSPTDANANACSLEPGTAAAACIQQVAPVDDTCELLKTQLKCIQACPSNTEGGQLFAAKNQEVQQFCPNSTTTRAQSSATSSAIATRVATSSGPSRTSRSTQTASETDVDSNDNAAGQLNVSSLAFTLALAPAVLAFLSS
ncbi:hypothetical protein H4R33_004838 [Dimargaris cristalligena]|nr:hypothetical protein H4R33_004838 [Dimargaris cristalligena]